MAKSKRGGKRKGAGRPSIGNASIRQIRVPAALSDAITQWSKKQADKPTFSEAVRRLVAKALNWQG